MTLVRRLLNRGPVPRPLAAQGADVGTFGVLWGAQSVLLDRVLVARRPPAIVTAIGPPAHGAHAA